MVSKRAAQDAGETFTEPKPGESPSSLAAASLTRSALVRASQTKEEEDAVCSALMSAVSADNPSQCRCSQADLADSRAKRQKAETAPPPARARASSESALVQTALFISDARFSLTEPKPKVTASKKATTSRVRKSHTLI